MRGTEPWIWSVSGFDEQIHGFHQLLLRIKYMNGKTVDLEFDPVRKRSEELQRVVGELSQYLCTIVVFE
jgi:hypothetical protein